MVSIENGEYFQVPASMDGHWALRAEVTDDVVATQSYMGKWKVRRDTRAPFSYGSEIDGDFRPVSLNQMFEIKFEPYDSTRGGNVGTPMSAYITPP